MFPLFSRTPMSLLGFQAVPFKMEKNYELHIPTRMNRYSSDKSNSAEGITSCVNARVASENRHAKVL
jgi:hypothetical protein